MKNSVKFANDQGLSMAIEVTPQIHPCLGNCGKCDRNPNRETDPNSHLQIKTPEERVHRRPLHEILNPQPTDNDTMHLYTFADGKPAVEKEAEPSSDLSDAAQKLITESQQIRELTLEMSLAPVEIEEDQGPPSELVIEKAKAIRRGFDTQNLIKEAVIQRARTIYGEKCIAESQKHQRQIAAERRAEWEQKHLTTKK